MVDGNCVMPGRALGSIKNGLETDKLDQVFLSLLKSKNLTNGNLSYLFSC